MVFQNSRFDKAIIYLLRNMIKNMFDIHPDIGEDDGFPFSMACYLEAQLDSFDEYLD